MAKALVLTVGGVLTALLNVLFADKLKASPWFTKALLDLAVERLPEAQRERFAEEWAGHLNDVSGEIAKVLFARGCVSAAFEMASVLGHPHRRFSRVLERSRRFLKQLWNRFVYVANAAGAVLFGEDSMLAKGRLAPTIIVPTLLLGLAGFLLSYAVPAKYTSQSTILVEGQQVPENMVQPLVPDDLTTRITTLQQQVLSDSRLKPVIEKVYPQTNGQEVEAMIDTIRENMNVEPVVTTLSEIGNMSGRPLQPGQSPVPGFTVSYTAPSPREAQEICNELTSLFVSENLKHIRDVASGTQDVLNRGLVNARNNLNETGMRLASLKTQVGIRKKQGAIATPDLEVQRQILTIEYGVSQKTYEDLLAKKSAADLTSVMNDMAEGERMFPIESAELPEAPASPNRFIFAAVGLGAGLALGVGLALWVKFRKKVSQSVVEEPVNLP